MSGNQSKPPDPSEVSQSSPLLGDPAAASTASTSPEVQVIKSVQKQNYSKTVKKPRTDEDKKWLVIELIKSPTEPHFSLNDNELAKLVYKRLRIDPKKMFRYDESYTGKIRLLVSKDVEIDDETKKLSFMIREGLKTRPLNEAGLIDISSEGTWVRIFWIHAETSPEVIKKELEPFGEIVSDIKFTVFKSKDDMTEEAKMLAANNVDG